MSKLVRFIDRDITQSGHDSRSWDMTMDLTTQKPLTLVTPPLCPIRRISNHQPFSPASPEKQIDDSKGRSWNDDKHHEEIMHLSPPPIPVRQCSQGDGLQVVEPPLERPSLSPTTSMDQLVWDFETANSPELPSPKIVEEEKVDRSDNDSFEKKKVIRNMSDLSLEYETVRDIAPRMPVRPSRSMPSVKRSTPSKGPMQANSRARRVSRNASVTSTSRRPFPGVQSMQDRNASERMHQSMSAFPHLSNSYRVCLPRTKRAEQHLSKQRKMVRRTSNESLDLQSVTRTCKDTAPTKPTSTDRLYRSMSSLKPLHTRSFCQRSKSGKQRTRACLQFP